ncbi:LysR family transcriptional regulator [Terasakiispira papahanaumokuakeensis]|uniref:LysR family transcriptional regulator n=1 Tax=Terasakiispira papahanaumokuakeensis TaxID=197479 RepID=A0A1E2VAJ6_9GAMM|nr:LysR family transcriptional regulator [Terasakiispira papahanaumokuakeensis]ODC03994.1 LysR family transcriptional regulator [Terasakiispira papahanaumokuakeensis]
MRAHKRLNVRLLEVFVAVARHQGFMGAQQALNLTTSAISNYMSELEAQLGFVLCQRGRAGFQLTEKGEQFLHQTVQFLGEFDALERSVEAIKGDLGGRLTMSVLDATVLDTTLSLPNVIRQFNQRYPAVHLDLQVRTPYEQIHGILNNQLDIAIGNVPSAVNNIIGRELYREQHWLYCADSHPLFETPQLTVERITQYGFVTRRYWNFSDLRKRGFGHSTATVENMEAQLALILSGQYVGYLPERYAQHFVKAQRLKPLLPSQFGYQALLSLICRRGRAREPLIRAMRELLIQNTADDA